MCIGTFPFFKWEIGVSREEFVEGKSPGLHHHIVLQR